MAQTKRLKYLGVEMLKIDAIKSSVPEMGLFRGLSTRSNGEGKTAKILNMIILGTKDKENDITALNLAIYNVLSLKMLYGDTKELIVFKANDVDQKKAMELLETALKEFQKEKRMLDNDPEIVDVKTFDDVPKEFFSKEEKKPVTGAGASEYSYGNMYGGGAKNCGYQDTEWQKKEAERKEQKELEEKLRKTPTLIKRKDAAVLPTLKVLNAIKKKVAAIAAGEYEGKLVDPDPKDTFENGKKTATV